jgi:riboflavin-specific deaminase-like protein
MVGIGTALVDDPLLTVRGRVAPREPPRRVIVDSAGRLPVEARVLSEGAGPVTVVTTARSGGTWRGEIEKKGGRIVEVDADDRGRVSLPEALGALRADGIHSLLCEGGGRLASAMLAGAVVDRLYLVLAPILLGSDGVPAFPAADEGSARAPEGRWRLIEEPGRLGEDMWIVLEPAED